MTNESSVPKKRIRRVKTEKVEEPMVSAPLPETDEKPRVAPRTFTFKGIELVPKRLTFALRKASLRLITDYRAFAKPYIAQVTVQLINSPRPMRTDFKTDEDFDKALKEYVIAIQEFQTENTIALLLYLSDAEKLKEVFTVFLEGEIDKIEFDTEDSVEQDQLMSIGVEVINSFFTLTMKSVFDVTKL